MIRIVEMSSAENVAVWLSVRAVPPSGMRTCELIAPVEVVPPLATISAADTSADDSPLNIVLACVVPGSVVVYSSNPFLLLSLS